tara:strand:- start:255 stop:1190 length:936 start_codon:yes stop_codon:yes gene_type:complete
MKMIDADQIAALTNWPMIVQALHDGHRGERAQLGDTLLGEGERKMLVRSAWVPGVGAGVKAVTVFPDNPSRTPALPSVQGQVLIFDPQTGAVAASLPGGPITHWKTAGDSALAASLLARENAAVFLMVGAGAMAEPLIRAHCSVRPGLQTVLIHNRNAQRAEQLAARLTDLGREVQVVTDLHTAVSQADIISTATLATEPFIEGRWLAPGVHLDLVGAYTPTMREADDETMRRGAVFVDSFDSTIEHIGEIRIPLQTGVLTRDDLQGDMYDLVQKRAGRRDADQITVFKNGGGAHLDVMVSAAIVAAAGAC